MNHIPPSGLFTRDAANADAVASELVRRGELSARNLAEALTLAAESGTDLASVLDRLGFISQLYWAETLAAMSGLPLLRLDAFPAELPVCERLSLSFQEQVGAVLVALSPERAEIAAADPADERLVKGVRLALRRPIRWSVALRRDVDHVLARERSRRAADSRTTQVDESITGADRLLELANDAPTVKFVERMFANALEKKATDIHVEPLERGARLRLRIDGLLIEDLSITPELYPGVVSRLKILSGIDIGERRLPQDGRIRQRAQGAQVDIRVSTLPTVNGESLALRLLDAKQKSGSLEALDMPAPVLGTFQWGIAQRSGLLLVTGPTGSGKTTTLHALLSELNDLSRKIVTVENPVEIRVPGVMQVEANPEIGLTFAAALRTFLRQDPDVIMVGEIRDPETAQVAVQAALTGHVVLSTLHTNDAATAFARLVDMGIEPYLVEAVLKLSGAQRLVRRLCDACAEPLPSHHAHFGMAMRHAASLDVPGPMRLRMPIGCRSCGETGYRGRRAVFEALDASMLREARTGKPSPGRGLFAHGLSLAWQGETSVDEVLRVLEETGAVP